MRKRLLAVLVLILVASAAGYSQQAEPKSRNLPVEIFQILGLPLNVHEAVLVEKNSSYLLRCRLSNESVSELRGLRYSLTALDAINGAIPIVNRIEGVVLNAHDTKTVTFETPIKFKARQGTRYVLMLEQIVSLEAIWEVIKAKDALDSYLKGDYSVQPNVMRVNNAVDAPPQTRVIY